MGRVIEKVCVYCGATAGTHPDYMQRASALGAEIARRRSMLVYGGGKVGLMGAVADAVIAGGGATLGVITHELKEREIGHDGLAELRVVDSMHERKKAMADLADAFVALPGGIGTLDELFEVLCWMQLAMHEKPVGLLNVRGFFDPVVKLLEHIWDEGFLRIAPREAVVLAEDPVELLDKLEAWPGITRRWWPNDSRPA